MITTKPGYSRHDAATEQIAKYVGNVKYFPLNRYCVTTDAPRDGGGYLSLSEDGGIYRGTRYCFPFELPVGVSDDTVGELAAMSAAQAMTCRSIQAAALLVSPGIWDRVHVCDNSYDVESKVAEIRGRLRDAGVDVDSECVPGISWNRLVLVINPNRSRRTFGSIRDRSALSYGGVPVVVENMVHVNGTNRKFVWPETHAVLCYQPSAPDLSGATLTFAFRDEMVVEINPADRCGRVVEDYIVSVNPSFGALFRFDD